MCLTKAEGGMGFKIIYAYNLAMLAKQGWRVLSKPHSLIAQIFKARYYPHSSFLEAELGEAPSFSWRSIMQGRKVLKADLQWKIGDGKNGVIWNDKWLPLSTPEFIQKPVDCTLTRVNELINEHTREWHSNVITATFPPYIAAKIMCIPLSRKTTSDRLIWFPEKKGMFSVKTAYWIARNQVLSEVLTTTSCGNPFSVLWKKLWAAKVPGKVKKNTIKPIAVENSTLTVKKVWKPASNGNMILNVDTAFLPNQHREGIGGVLRDAAGNFIAAFTRSISHTASPKQCELLAIREGMDMLYSLQTCNVQIHSECQEAVAEVKTPDYELLANGGIVDDIRLVQQKLMNVCLKHTPRTCNIIAHRLAAIAFKDNLTCTWLDYPPDCITDILQIEIERLH
ncbi:hypothetical protein ACLB2K_010693 [Fragaria x ananassa]